MRRIAFGERREAAYFVEAKHHADGVSPIDVAGALAWAAAEMPDTLVFAVSSHLTTPCREHVSRWSQNNPRVRPVVWERTDLENRVLQSRVARDAAVAMGLLPPMVLELLPPNPAGIRKGPSDHGLEMEYRYWLTDDEAEKLDHVMHTMNRLVEVLQEEAPERWVSDLTGIAVPNWTTFLSLLQAQIRLEVAVRDYLLSQAAGHTDCDLQMVAARVQERAAEVRAVGDNATHHD